jgi:signal transduction histidine kinase
MMAFKAGVQLLIEQDATACRLDMDPVLIEQVLLNLMKNAIEAMVEAQTRRPHIIVRTAVGAAFWRVEVADNGPGLADNIKNELFTPFYSTKPDGMGIGLNICRSIVEFHRGEFSVSTSVSGGCVFWFTLPLQPRRLSIMKNGTRRVPFRNSAVRPACGGSSTVSCVSGSVSG